VDSVARFEFTPDKGSLRYDQFGGYPEVVARARQLIETQFEHRELLQAIGAKPVRGVLMSGPPGTGKTYLAKIIAAEADASFFLVSGPSIVSKYVGDTEHLLRQIFEAAETRERAIVFFDEIDSIAGERNEGSHESSDRLVAQLLTEMDGFRESIGNVIILAATNRPDRIDPALRRPGRFDWEVSFGLPSAEDRLAILEVDARRLSTNSDLPLEEVADLTEGWSAAKLASIWTEAALLAATDRRDSIDAEDLLAAFAIVAKTGLDGTE
jgi:transitional endoplasmic reticulum ATPase